MKALGFAIAIALGATAAVGQDRPTNDQLIGYFETVVFGNEVPGREATIIRKWDGVIRYKFGGITAVVERSRGAAEAHMATLTRFSNLRFEEIAAADPGEQMIIWFTDTARMEDAGLALAAEPTDLVGTEGARCFFLSYYNAGGGRCKLPASSSTRIIFRRWSSTAWWRKSPRHWGCPMMIPASSPRSSTTPCNWTHCRSSTMSWSGCFTIRAFCRAPLGWTPSPSPGRSLRN